MDHKAKAYGYAIRLLSYQDRSCYELSERLSRKGFAARCIAKTIRRLQDEGLLNDLHFAINFCRAKIEHQRFGRQRLILELKKRGIDEEVREKALHLISHDYGEDETLRRAIEERTWRTGPPRSARELSNLIDYLARRGFPRAKIWEALRALEIPLRTEKH